MPGTRLPHSEGSVLLGCLEITKPFHSTHAPSPTPFTPSELPREKKLQLIADPARLAQLLPQLNDGDYTPLSCLSLAEWVKGERE